MTDAFMNDIIESNLLIVAAKRNDMHTSPTLEMICIVSSSIPGIFNVIVMLPQKLLLITSIEPPIENLFNWINKSEYPFLFSPFFSLYWHKQRVAPRLSVRDCMFIDA